LNNDVTSLISYRATALSRAHDVTVIEITPTLDTTALLYALKNENKTNLSDSGFLGGLLIAAHKKKKALEIKSSASHDPIQPGRH
jgi:hypothetical protein